MAKRLRKLSDADRRAAARARELWAEYQKRNPGVSQEVAAERADMTQSAFSQFLNERVPMRVEPVLKLARLFGVEPREIRPDLVETRYVHEGKTNRLEAREPSIGGLSDDAIQIAVAFNRMSAQTQDFIRSIVFTYGVIDKSFPWLRIGRPRSHNYAPWEKWHEENYRANLAIEAARVKKLSR